MTLISDTTEIGHWGMATLQLTFHVPHRVQLTSSHSQPEVITTCYNSHKNYNWTGWTWLDRDGEQTQIAAESDIYLLGTHSFNDISPIYNTIY